MKKITFLILLMAGLSASLFAQLSIDAASTDYTVDLDATVSGVNNGQFLGTGFNPSPASGQLDSDAWATTGMSDGATTFGGTFESGDHARGNTSGGVSSGGFYSFTVGTGNNAFGAQPTSGDWTPGTITFRMINNTGSTITSIDVDYNIVVYNNEMRANSFIFSYSSDDASYTDVSALDFTTPEAEDGSPVWVTTARTTTISSLSVADGNYFYIRWSSNDVSGSGSRDEFGVDDIVINVAAGGNAAPQIANISYTPLYPTSSQSVSVSADITDSDGTLTTTELNWGLSSGSLTNTVTMSNGGSGDTYSGTIPAQADGSTVYFEIYAVDNDAGSTTSPEQSYDVTDPATTTLPYNETYDADLGDCYTFSVSGDTKEWYWFDTDQAAKMSGYNSGDLEEDWLILPGIDFDNYSDEFMTFDTWYKYGDDDADNYLKLMYSSTYSGTGDPSGSGWTELSYTQPASAEVWTSSGVVDLSAFTGTSVYIAFKYRSTSVNYRTWEVDNISIQEATSDPEPTNYPTAFTATADNAFAITTTWTDATGAQLPAGYLILANLTGTFTPPVDGTPVVDDSNLGDGSGAMNVAYGVETYQWTGLSDNMPYYFTIYPYTNSASTIDYKTDGTPPTANATTDEANTDLMISEVADPGDNTNARFIELYNISSETIDFDAVDWYIVKNVQTGSRYSFKLAGDVLAGDKFVVAGNSDGFTNAYGFTVYQSNSQVSGNGDDSYYLYINGDHNTGGVLVDAYGVLGEDGTGTDWDYEDTKAVRLRSVTEPNTTWTAAEWDIPGSADVDDMTPSEHKDDVTWAAGGTEADDWNEKGGNWSGTWCYIPDASFNVTVPMTTVSPVIYSEAACNDLTVQAGGSLDISVNEALTTYGLLDVISGGSFIVLSNASGNGSFIGKDMMFGDVTIERYIEGYVGNDGWHQISSPIDGMLISGSDFEPGTVSPNLDDLYEWIEQTATWHNYKSTGSFTSFTGGQGYLAAYETSATKQFTGQLTGWDFDIQNLPYTSFKGNGWNFLGNPYPSALEWNTTDWALTHIGNVAEIWDESAGNYAMINTGDPIPSTNGFFVQVASSAYHGDNSLTIPASARIHNTTNNYKSGSTQEMAETLVLKVTNDENTYYDVNRIGFRADATEAWDIAFDAHKLSGSETAPQLWTVSNDELFAQNYLPYTAEEYMVPLHFRAGVNSTYHINTIGLESFYEGTDIYLEDLFTDKIITLSEQQLYTFTATTEDDEARFILHFNGITSTGETPASDNSRIYTYRNTVYIKFNDLPTDTYTVEVINMIGQQVYANEFAPGNLNSFNIDEKPGIYFVRLRAENKTVVQKVMISK